ncbi:MAG: hypothetical protein IPF39_08320 [Comamonadaceae bacterium]|uniref:DUF7017 domain-containing protein n=1 Tax=Candidatus Skiveiella danica TaxID=3386177 RepID=UPI00390B455D|nr:hypothetical protein [Comamonadaceae bacterium]
MKLDKAKGLMGLGRHDDALAFGMAVTKAKANDYWAWELLGDIVALTDPAAALGCYCKALCCPADDKFTGKVRLKLAESMIETHDFSAAKLEVETVLRQKEREGTTDSRSRRADCLAAVVCVHACQRLQCRLLEHM